MSSTTTDTIDPPTVQYFINLLRHCWGARGPNFCDVIAASCGWSPLVKGEQMTIHHNGKEYVIKRKK